MTDIADRTFLADLLARSGDVTWVYADASLDREDPTGLAATRGRDVRDRLVAAGAPAETAEFVAERLFSAPGAPAPVSRLILAEDGEIVVDEILPGALRLPESLGHGPCPEVLPLLVHRPLDVALIVAEVGRDGGGFRVYRLGHAGWSDEQHVQGRTDTLHKIKGGGWEHRRLQSHTEEIWRQNTAEVAEAIATTVRDISPRLIVVAGDIHARRLLVDQLPIEMRDLVTVADLDPRAPDASDDALAELVEISLARILATRVHDAIDVLRTHVERGDGRAVVRKGEIVTALAAAQVDTLLIDPSALPDDTLIALGAPPWVASSPEEALGAPELCRESAVRVLIRAAILTDARVVVTAAGPLPGDVGAAALLRWPVGPSTPASNSANA